MSQDWHITIRHFIDRACIFAIVFLGFYFFMHHVAPPVQPTNGPVAVQAVSHFEKEVSALEKSQSTIERTLRGVVSLTDRPGATVIHDVVHGYTLAQAAQILHGTKPVTQTKIAVSESSPVPAPIPTGDFDKRIFNDAYAADTHAIAQTKQNITISQQEAPRSLLGSNFQSDGSTGLSFAFLRGKEFETNIVGALKNNHIEMGVCEPYIVPHTALAGGPCIMADHGIKFAFGITENF